MPAPLSLHLDWEPPGPVAAAFMRDRARVSVLNGPVGSGKTTTVLVKGIRLAAEQRPSPRRRVVTPEAPDGLPLRMFRLCVVRDTYRQLWRTTLPSWWKRVPREIGEWQGGENQPCSHKVTFALGRSAIELIADFIAIGDNSVEDALRGYEPTAFYLNEADLLGWEVFEYAVTRIGRYPETEDGGATWSGVLMDCNAPIIGSDFHEHVFLRPAGGLKLFRQPGGRDPAAENRRNLPPDYYETMVRYSRPALVRRMVDNVPGFTEAGKSVHDEFNDLLHVADHELDPVPGLPLYAGFDAGLDPAMLIGQKLGNGRWHILDEVVSEHGTGAVRFARNVNELLRERYGDWQLREDPWAKRGSPRIRGWADPSAAWGVDRKEDEQTWIDIVAYQTGIRIDAAPSNDTTLRREALRRVLTLMPDGKPAFVLSPRCVRTRAGLAGGFRYRKMQLGAQAERWTDEVEKNLYSHPCEALEYLMLGGGEGAEVQERRQRGFDTHNLPRQAQGDWSPP